MSQKNSRPATGTSAPNSAPFPYADYVHVQRALKKALLGPHFYALLTGPSGTGKTSVLRDISAQIDHGRHHVVYVSSSRVSLVSIVRLLATSFHVNPHRSHLETIHALTDAIRIHTTHLLLWIDEADQLDPEVLQQLRMLAESSPSPEPLMSMVLSGLSDLVEKLNSPALFPLKRRLSLRWTLAGLRRDELDPFIEHRFGTRDAQRIPQNVRDDLFERTQAVPALIDQVLREALAQSNQAVDPETLRASLDIHARG